MLRAPPRSRVLPRVLRYLAGALILSSTACSLVYSTDSFVPGGDPGAPDGTFAEAATPPVDAPISDDAGIDAELDATFDAFVNDAARDGATNPGLLVDARAYEQAILDAGPVAYWPFDDSTGTATAANLIDSGVLHATTLATVAFGANGAVGTGVAFVKDGFLDGGGFFDQDGSAPYSIEFWATLSNANVVNQPFVQKRSGTSSANYQGYYLYEKVAAAEGAIAVNFEQDNVASVKERFTSAAFVPSSTFTHVVTTFDGSVVRLYLNGALATTDAPDGSAQHPTSTDAGLAVGLNFTGTMDELALYARALTDAEVSAHHLLGLP